jgi:hypothetical protein
VLHKNVSIPSDSEITAYVERALARQESDQVKAEMKKSTYDMVKDMDFWDWLATMSMIGALMWVMWIVGIGNPFEPPAADHWAKDGWLPSLVIMLLTPVTLPLSLYVISVRRKEHVRRKVSVLRIRLAGVVDSVQRDASMLDGIDEEKHNEFLISAADSDLSLAEFRELWLSVMDGLPARVTGSHEGASRGHH